MEITQDHLTIYPNFSQRQQSFSLSSGEKIKVPLLDSTILKSLVAYQELEGEKVFLPYQIISPREAFDPKQKSEISVEKNGNTYEGILINKGDNSVTILQLGNPAEEKILQIRKYDFLRRNRHLDPTQEYLVISVEESDPITLNYLFNNLSWSGQYTIIIDQGEDGTSSALPGTGRTALLRFSALINNSTFETIETTGITLVSGKIKSVSSRESFKAVQAEKPELTTDEYLTYDLEGLRLEDQTSIDLFLEEIPVEKIYYNMIGQSSVTFGYRFIAPEDLPQGSAYVYNGSESLVGSLLGSTNLPEKRKGEKVKLILGETTRIQVKTNLSEKGLNLVDGHPTEKEITVHSSIINRTKEVRYLILQQFIGKHKIKSLKPHLKYEREKGLIKFNLQLNPHSERKFDYTLILQSI